MAYQNHFSNTKKMTRSNVVIHSSLSFVPRQHEEEDDDEQLLVIVFYNTMQNKITLKN
jgi:hypothetical protein